MCCAWSVPAQATGAAKLLGRPDEPARPPHAAACTLPDMLFAALAESVTCVSDLLAHHHWRPEDLAPDAHYVANFPSCRLGTLRSALCPGEVSGQAARAQLPLRGVSEGGGAVLQHRSNGAFGLRLLCGASTSRFWCRRV